jgi:hypothetical protein
MDDHWRHPLFSDNPKWELEMIRPDFAKDGIVSGEQYRGLNFGHK